MTELDKYESLSTALGLRTGADAQAEQQMGDLEEAGAGFRDDTSDEYELARLAFIEVLAASGNSIGEGTGTVILVLRGLSKKASEAGSNSTVSTKEDRESIRKRVTDGLSVERDEMARGYLIDRIIDLVFDEKKGERGDS
jgi:hypothetical protein